MQGPVHIVGASGRSGVALCRALAARGRDYVPVVRDQAKWARTGLPGAARVAELGDPRALAAALDGAGAVVSCAHARYAPALLRAVPEGAGFVLLGSTRRFTRWIDDHGAGVLVGEVAFRASGRPGVLLHPTMIYGAEGEDNVRRLAAVLRRLPVLPLPGGGRNLVQPIHQDDLTLCILAALERDWAGPKVLVVAGPEAVSYADFAREVARAAGVTAPPIVNMPAGLLMAASPLTVLPGLPRIRAAEIRRLLEDKAFSITAMVETLGVRPRALAAGLVQTFG